MSVADHAGGTGAAATALDGTDALLLDLDGVVYLGPQAVPGAADAVASARRRNVGVAYVTNNASRTAADVADHLRSLGLPAQAQDVVTSAMAAAALLAERLPRGAAVLVVGADGLRQAVGDAGLTPVDRLEDGPLAVVQGFGPDVGWRHLAEATRAVRSGLPYLATNLDLTLPTEHGPAPGNGTLVNVVATASGVQPDVAGKPGAAILRVAAERLGAARPLVVGDRLDTDIAGARAAGMASMLVLSGVHGIADLLQAPPSRRPDLVGADLSALAAPPVPTHAGADPAPPACDHAVHGTTLAVPAGPVESALPTACQAAWAWQEEHPDRVLDVAAAATALEGALRDRVRSRDR